MKEMKKEERKSGKKSKILVIIISILIAILLVIGLLKFLVFPNIKINGKEVVEVEYNTKYEERSFCIRDSS